MIKKGHAHITLDIHILKTAKENAKRRGQPLSRYINFVLGEYFALKEYFAQIDNLESKETENDASIKN